MAWSQRLKLALVAGAAVAVAAVALPVVVTHAADTPGGVDNYDGPKKKRMSPEELGKLRMLEIKSGAYRDAKAIAGSQQMVGAPLSDREKVQHVLNRMAFGGRPGQVEKILEEGGSTDQWKMYAKIQLKPDAIDDSEVEKYIDKRYPWHKSSVAELKEKYPYRGDGLTWEVLKRELPDLVVAREVMGKREFAEVMNEFWRNHLCIDNSPSEAKPRSWAAIRYEEDVIRANSFGKFKNMVFASARHPAMLDYLDNRLSKANNWNENYARELMELHTLGADRGYTDVDVLELSKVLTGWNYDDKFAFSFKSDWHQGGVKTVLGTQIGPGYEGGEKAIYMLVTHKNTAEFISKKLIRYLINDEPPTALVAKVAAVFQRTEGDLPKVYEEIIMSPEFVDRANYRAKFKTPVEFVVSAMRATNAKVEDTHPTVQTLARMGEEVYACPDPTGYYDTAEAWMDAGVLTTRWDYSLELGRGRVKGVSIDPKLVSRYAAMKPDDRFVTMVRDFIGDDIGDKTRQALNEANVANDVPRMIGVLLGSPSFQQQ